MARVALLLIGALGSALFLTFSSGPMTSVANAGPCSGSIAVSPRLADSGYRPCKTFAAVPQKTVKRVARGGGRVGRLQYCVRLSDGYFFPTPHSQFAGEKDVKTTLDLCRHICADENVELFTLHDVSQETDSMVSVATGKRYTELATAALYRASPDFKACDMQRYFRALDVARAAAPDRLAETAALAAEIPATEMTAVEAPAEPPVAVAIDASRTVREVGWPYFPERDTVASYAPPLSMAVSQ
jgi:hypothetical protein